MANHFKSRHALELLISAVLVFVFSQLKDVVPPDRAFIEWIAATLALFILIELARAGTLIESNSNRFDGAVGKLDSLKGAIDKALNEVGEMSNRLRPLEIKLGEQVEKTDKLMGDMLETLKIMPNFHNMTSGLDRYQRDRVASSVLSSFGDYSRAWRQFGEHLKFEGSPQLAYAWAGLIETYLNEEREQLEKRVIATSSQAYTKLIYELTSALLEVYPDAGLGVTQVTAMLPDEFFNWPQAAHARQRSFPIHLARAWVGSDEYFRQLAELKDRVRFERYILVRDGSDHSSSSGSYELLHSFEELRGLGGHWIGTPLRYDDFRRMGLKKLFALSAKLSSQRVDFEAAAQISRIGDLRFYPIGPKGEFTNEFPPDTRLIDKFIADFHSAPEAARFCFAQGEADSVYRAFLARNDLLPEATIFSVNGRNGSVGEQAKPREVLFALKGSLIPFTDRMLVELISGEDRSMLEEARAALENSSYPVSCIPEWREGRTPEYVVQEWNRAYETEAETDWEKLPSDDLLAALSKLELKEVNTVLDVGCGRGRRIMDVIARLPAQKTLNRDGVEIVGIDFAEEAIKQANQALRDRRERSAVEGVDPIRCDISFVKKDLIDYAEERRSKFDLVIDWMSFHEVPPTARVAYIAALGRLSRYLLLINVFSREAVETDTLNMVVGKIPKYRFTETELRDLLKPEFVFYDKKWSGARIAHPSIPHSDGIIAAKAAYLFRKRPQEESASRARAKV